MELELPETLMTLLERHQATLWWMGIGSALMLVASAMLVPVLIVRLPVDFYSRDNRGPIWFHDAPLARAVFLVVKNAIGAVLLFAGLAMLVLPGQGLLTILIALAMLNFPGKKKLEMNILRRDPVRNSMNWVRRRAGKEPLEL
ncbi:MAG: PGPGW domain-containing protein [Gammaproteobacteria bacterium]|nr:PGPGW domain-containing protein [Gammaproteobacteria bacterium]